MMDVSAIIFQDNSGHSTRLGKHELGFFQERNLFKKIFYAPFVLKRLVENKRTHQILPVFANFLKKRLARIYDESKLENFLWTGMFGFTPCKLVLGPGDTWEFKAIPKEFLNCIKYRQTLVDKKHKIFEWRCAGKVVYSDNERIAGLYTEYLSDKFREFYHFKVIDKTVLDVGGFVGDSALYFLENGAKRVMVYEPVTENLRCATFNLKKYKNRVELNQAFVCNTGGSRNVSSEQPTHSLGFGMSAGKHKLRVNCVPVKKILAREGIDIAKFDCEGCEYNILSVPNNTLKKIPYWSIEFHSIGKNRKKMSMVLDKFRACGFSIVRTYKPARDIRICDFQMH